MFTQLVAEPGGGLVEPVHHGTHGSHRLQHGVAHGGPELQVISPVSWSMTVAIFLSRIIKLSSQCTPSADQPWRRGGWPAPCCRPPAPCTGRCRGTTVSSFSWAGPAPPCGSPRSAGRRRGCCPWRQGRRPVAECQVSACWRTAKTNQNSPKLQGVLRH